MATKKKTPTVKAITIKEVSLNERQKNLISEKTPEVFIKERVGRGGKNVKYVEGGYIVNKLNQCFGPLNWSFEILDSNVEEKEVYVRGKLTVKDHKQGFDISKEQYGQSSRQSGVPLGDTLKAASTDSLKKCASFGFGIALDVYWQQLDDQTPKNNRKAFTASDDDMFTQAVKLIENCGDIQTLDQWAHRIEGNAKYSAQQKKKLIGIINTQVEKIQSWQKK